MQTIDYISNDVKPFSLNDKIDKVKNLFIQSSFSHLPIVNQNVFYGTIAKQDIEFIDFNNKKLNAIQNQLKPFYVSNKMNWFEVLQFFATHKTNLMPVLDSNKKYLGYYELDDFLNIFKCTPFLHEDGVVMVIAKGVNDYSFSEIIQIVESNNATLLGAFVSKIENDMAHITLKLSLHDINNTLHLFRRYNYHILNEFEKDEYLEKLHDRSNYLKKYLNI